MGFCFWFLVFLILFFLYLALPFSRSFHDVDGLGYSFYLRQENGIISACSRGALPLWLYVGLSSYLVSLTNRSTDWKVYGCVQDLSK